MTAIDFLIRSAVAAAVQTLPKADADRFVEDVRAIIERSNQRMRGHV